MTRRAGAYLRAQTADGEVSFQEYFTTLACEPAVTGFKYAGAEDAMLTQEVSDALDSEDLEAVVITPATTRTTPSARSSKLPHARS